MCRVEVGVRRDLLGTKLGLRETEWLPRLVQAQKSLLKLQVQQVSS